MSRRNDRLKAKAYETLSKAVIKKCRDDCCAGDVKSWRECHIERCPLHPHRLGNTNIAPNQKSKKNEPIYTGNLADFMKEGVSSDEVAHATD